MWYNKFEIFYLAVTGMANYVGETGGGLNHLYLKALFIYLTTIFFHNYRLVSTPPPSPIQKLNTYT